MRFFSPPSLGRPPLPRQTEDCRLAVRPVVRLHAWESGLGMGTKRTLYFTDAGSGIVSTRPGRPSSPGGNAPVTGRLLVWIRAIVVSPRRPRKARRHFERPSQIVPPPRRLSDNASSVNWALYEPERSKPDSRWFPGFALVSPARRRVGHGPSPVVWLPSLVFRAGRSDVEICALLDSLPGLGLGWWAGGMGTWRLWSDGTTSVQIARLALGSLPPNSPFESAMGWAGQDSA